MINLPHGFKKTLPAKGEAGYEPWDPQADLPKNGHGKRNLAIGGAAAGVPGYLYARGLKGENRWRDIPSKIKDEFAHYRAAGGLGSGAAVHGVTGTIREGVISSGKDIASVGPRIWRNVKGIGKGLAGKALSSDARLIQLSAKLDRLIQFETEADKFNRAYAQWVNSPEFKQHVHDIRKKAAIVGAGTAGVVGGTGLVAYGIHKAIQQKSDRNILGAIERGERNPRMVSRIIRRVSRK